MNATATHDTKRSEDVRARINVLSELGPEWTNLVRRWRATNAPARGPVDENEEYFLYQNMLGAWPLFDHEVEPFRERVKQYIVKAAREAREHTSWIEPSEEHEDALQQFVDHLFDHKPFQESFRPFAERIAFAAVPNSLSQVVIKTTAPGLPDIYRGTMQWDFSLVDPDNRRPVPPPPVIPEQASLPELLANWRDGQIKAAVSQRALRFRREKGELFRNGSYIPLRAQGARSQAIFGFARRSGSEWSLTVTPRFVAADTRERLPAGHQVWGDTTIALPDGAPAVWRNVLTDTPVRAEAGHLRAGDVCEILPVAILSATGS